MTGKYHLGENNYRCKSLINSKTNKMVQKSLIPKHLVRMKLQTLQIFQILLGMTFAGSWSVVSGACSQAFTFLFIALTLSRSWSVVRGAQSKHSLFSRR